LRCDSRNCGFDKRNRYSKKIVKLFLDPVLKIHLMVEQLAADYFKLIKKDLKI